MPAATHIVFSVLLTVLLPLTLSLLSRLRLLYRATIVGGLYAAVLLLLLGTSLNWPVLLIVSTAVVLINVKLTDSDVSNPVTGTMLLVLNIVIPVVFVGIPGWFPGFDPTALNIVSEITKQNVIFRGVTATDVHNALVFIFALVVVTREINNPIAMILKHSNLMPQGEVMRSGNHLYESSPARGKVIGYLERTLILIFGIMGNLEVLGVVLVAKGIARFRQLDDRDFAEYVLIGTLLSITGALIVVHLSLALIITS